MAGKDLCACFLLTLENCCFPLENVKRFGNGSRFDNGAQRRQIPVQHGDSAGFAEGFPKGPDHFRATGCTLFAHEPDAPRPD